MLTSSRYRTGIASGAPVPAELMRDLISKLNLRDLTLAYGMSTSHLPSYAFQTLNNSL